MATNFEFFIIGGGIVSGHATTVFRRKGVKPGEVATISTDSVLKNYFGNAAIRMREAEDVDDLLNTIKGKKNGKAIILRGGFLAVDLAIAMKDYGYDVTLVFPDMWCVPCHFTTQIATLLEDHCCLKRINVIKGMDAVDFESNESEEKVRVKLADGSILNADVVFLGVHERPITTVSKDKEHLGELKMDAFFRSNIPNVYILGNVISGKLQDFINVSDVNETKPTFPVIGHAETVTEQTVISINKDKFKQLLEPKSTVVILTGLHGKLSPQCYTSYICDLCEPMPRVLEEGPMAIILVPEDDIGDILSLFKETVCKAYHALDDSDICYCDVVVMTTTQMENLLSSVSPHVFKFVSIVVLIDADKVNADPILLIDLLNEDFVNAQVILVNPAYTGLVGNIAIRCSGDRGVRITDLETNSTILTNT